MKSEKENIEFKRSLDVKRIVQTVASFATARGGTIFVGINNDGDVVGVDVGKSTIENLSNEIVRNTEPRQYPSIKVQKKENKDIIQILVEEGQFKPVFAYNVPYKRVGRSNHKLSRDETIKMGRESQAIYWDEEICGADISEICAIVSKRVITRNGMIKQRHMHSRIGKTFNDISSRGDGV